MPEQLPQINVKMGDMAPRVYISKEELLERLEQAKSQPLDWTFVEFLDFRNVLNPK